MRSLLFVFLVAGATTTAHAQLSTITPIVPSPATCVEAAIQIAQYSFCSSVPIAGGAPCTPPPVTQCWDFEAGLSPWTNVDGTAFATQPTWGDNVSTERVLITENSPVNSDRTMLEEMEQIGGDYWKLPRPIGHEGNRWIGTAENRPDATVPWGRMQGAGPTGTLVSPSFTIDRDYVTFLVGGGCDTSETRVELQVYQEPFTFCRPQRGFQQCTYFPGMWVTAYNPFAEEPALQTSGACSDLLERRAFKTDATSGLQGRTARVVIVDAATMGMFGHINVDDVRHTNVPPDDPKKNTPLWGFADTHVHIGAELSMRSLGDGFPSSATRVAGADGALIHGSTGLSPSQNRALLAGELGTCDGEGHGTDHSAKTFVETLELTSLGGESKNFPLGCWEGEFGSHVGHGCSFWGQGPLHFATPKAHQHPNGGVGLPGLGGDDLVGWPYWYTRTHQTVHLTWLQRAYLGGQRLIVASAVNNETLGNVMRRSPGGTYLSDYGALRRFAIVMKGIANANSSWMAIAFTPAQARAIVQSGRLAVVLATEVDDLGSKCSGRFTNTAADDPLDHGKTVKTAGDETRWALGRDRTDADSCDTPEEWRRRIDDLYNVGYRVVMPVHLADNDLGGTAIYSELFNTNSEFMTGGFVKTLLDDRSTTDATDDVTWTLPQDQHKPGYWYGTQAGWTTLGAVDGYASSTPAPIPTHVPYLFPVDHFTNMMAAGFVNERELTSNGVEVVKALMARGMIIDIAHLDQRGRNRILGLGAYAVTSSPIAPNCLLSDPACQRSAYPVISSHAGFRELMMPRDESGGGPSEGALTREMILRIAAIGGTIGVGVSATDTRSVDAATGTSPWGSASVPDGCAGSTRSFAQTYLYALRRTGGKGITLGTDFNGLEDRLNPRFGTLACHARGNLPKVAHFAWNGAPLIIQTASMPYRLRPGLLAGAPGTRTAREQADRERTTPGLHYMHYNNRVPLGSPAYFRLTQPLDFVKNLQDERFDLIDDFGNFAADSMVQLGQRTPLVASQTGNRTFDLNYDGLAHYGMLPDMIEDAATIGLRSAELEPLFRGAEDFVQTWERSCNLGAPSYSVGCN